MTSWKNNNALGSKRLAEEALENEIKTVSFEEYRRELSKLQRKYRSYASHIEIFAMDSIYEDSGIQMGINWASIGTVSPEKAEEFARTLSEAIEDCKNFKYNGYVIDWTTPFKVNH